ncbi:MAG: hypothetical protein ACKPEA_08705, partial [Planctomycetota bacterium]
MQLPPNPAAEIQALIQAEQYMKAFDLSERVLARSRGDLAGWLGRACANLGLGRWAEADVDSRAAERIAPDDPNVLLVRGVAHYRLGRMEESA